MVQDRDIEDICGDLLPLQSDQAITDAVLERIGDARIVLLGEASHGTHEFYRLREHITRRLIVEKGFGAVACEADWPDAYRVNRYVRGGGPDDDAIEALTGFQRFPQWMWRNEDVHRLVMWMHQRNGGRSDRAQVGFYGLDLYSMQRSMAEVLDYLQEHDGELAHEARQAYSCLGDYGDPASYALACTVAGRESCQTEVLRVVQDLRLKGVELMQRDGLTAADGQFAAERNAELVRDAEDYYRRMYDPSVSGWNLRDQHMVSCLAALIDHLHKTRGHDAGKVVVWAHNSHLGDARATEMGRYGEVNIGHLARERWGAEVFNLGFTTAVGTVAAARDWGGDVERRTINEPLGGSWEQLFHDHAPDNCLIDLRNDKSLARQCDHDRLERAIGVIYRPETERRSHYFAANLARQFDAVVHVDETRAINPLDRSPTWRPVVPETWPSGL